MSALRGVRHGASRQSDDGTSAVEMVMYTPLLMVITFIIVQFAFAYLGNQVASGAAREGARVARVGGGTSAALADGEQRAREVISVAGKGMLEPGSGDVTASAKDVGTPQGGDVTVTVTGRAVVVIPWIDLKISRTVSGPVEVFRPDR